MSEFESVFESDVESGSRSAPRAEGRLKWAVYRLNEETYLRLLAKRQRGEKINFKERGGDHQFTSANRKPTAERLSDECGSGYFIVEHLFGGVADDWSFVRIEPSVTAIGNEAVIASSGVTGPSRSPDPDSALQVLLERFGELEKHQRRRFNRPRKSRRTSSRPNAEFQGQLRLVLDLQRESHAREVAMWRQLLESVRSGAQSSNTTASTVPASVDNAYAMFAPLAANNPTLAEKLLDRAFPQTDEDKATWLGDLLKHPQEAVQLLQMGFGLLGARAGTPAAPVELAAATPANEQEAVTMVIYALIDDVQKNRRVGRVADMIDEQCRRFPSLQQQVAALLTLDCATLFQQIHVVTQVDLSSYAHAPEFIEDLRDEVSASFAGPEDASASSVEASSSKTENERVARIEDARSAHA